MSLGFLLTVPPPWLDAWQSQVNFARLRQFVTPAEAGVQWNGDERSCQS